MHPNGNVACTGFFLEGGILVDLAVPPHNLQVAALQDVNGIVTILGLLWVAMEIPMDLTCLKFHGFDLHKPSIKGAKLLFKIIKEIIIITIRDATNRINVQNSRQRWAKIEICDGLRPWRTARASHWLARWGFSH